MGRRIAWKEVARLAAEEVAFRYMWPCADAEYLQEVVDDAIEDAVAEWWARNQTREEGSDHD